MAINVKFIWMDGQMMEAEKATVPFLNTTLHYGLGVFEGIRCYDADQGPAIFRLAEHMERLNQSAKVLGFRQLPYSVETLCQAARDVVSVNGLRSCYIRPLIFHDSPSCGLNLEDRKSVV